VKLLILLIVPALFGGCETTPRYAYPVGPPPLPAGAHLDPGVNQYFAEQNAQQAQVDAEQAAQQAQDQARQDQNNRDIELQQRIQQAIYNDHAMRGDN
jgi:hypothetical protein